LLTVSTLDERFGCKEQWHTVFPTQWSPSKYFAIRDDQPTPAVGIS
jgi:hypothetical protein